MPLAIIAGLAFLALEVAALVWLFHWLTDGSIGIIAIAVVIALGTAATLIAWAAVSMAGHSDNELDRFMAEGDNTEMTHDSSAKDTSAVRRPQRSASSVPTDRPTVGSKSVALDLTHGKATGNYR